MFWKVRPTPAPKHFIVDENMGIWDDEGKELGRGLNGEWEREWPDCILLQVVMC